jgi:sugar O-acyltransferase (sialic acid O-acetyltransferase NeuD family)
MTGVYLLGGGGHCKQVIDILENNDIKILGIFDDYKIKNDIFYGYKIIDTIENLELYMKENINLFCTIGDNKIRETIYNKYKKYNFINCISKKSNISKSVKIIGTNNYIGDFTNILADTIIGSNNIINTNSNIAHDVIIRDNNHICPSSVLGGSVIIGSNNLIGTNATINPKITIGNNSIIGSGSVIIRNVLDNLTIVGNPGKVLKINSN